MSWGWDNAVVAVLVLAAGAWAVRSIWRAVKGRKVCSSCASQGDCPAANAKPLHDLNDMTKL